MTGPSIESMDSGGHLLVDLNEAQKLAVTHEGGPVLVVAGAGSGKTRVLTRRLSYLVANGVHPLSILAITFTNKAAAEMRARVASTLEQTYGHMWVSTFHSASVRMLRSFATELGYHPGFSIYDSQDSQRLLSQVITGMGLDVKRFPPKGVASQISAFKSEMVSPEELGQSGSASYEAAITKVYLEYQQRLLRNNAMDFDDLLLNVVRLFRRSPEVLSYFRQRFSHVLVDEYQDTNRVQNEVVLLLTEESRNAFAVGDADQSIYRFRGADVGNILEFEKAFPDATVILLEQNYRSTSVILSAANGVISNNSFRIPKQLWTEKTGGDLISVTEVPTDRDEAKMISEQVLLEVRDNHRSYGDLAVFYRANAQSRLLEEELVKSQIPYRVVGGTRFYDRKEVKDALAYLRLVVNPADEVSLRRVINVPKRGVGDTTVAKLAEFARDMGVTMLEALGSPRAFGASAKASAELLKFKELLAAIAEKAEAGVSPNRICIYLLSESGLRAEISAERTYESESRLENLDELVRVAETYETLGEFLEESALYSSSDVDTDGSAVTLMTLHAAKGLEFPVVFITGLEDGVFPHFRSMVDSESLEEERRLIYVGITRAMQKLYLSYASQRGGEYNGQYNPPSRFLSELPSDLVIGNMAGRRKGVGDSASQYRNWSTYSERTSTIRSGYSRPDTKLPTFKVGDDVFHKKFGEGTIVGSTGFGSSTEVEVRFEGFGTKRLILAEANLKKLNG